MAKKSARNISVRMCTRVGFFVLDPEEYLHPKTSKAKPMHESRPSSRQYAKHTASLIVQAANEISRSGASVVSMRGSCDCEPRVKVRAAEEGRLGSSA